MRMEILAAAVVVTGGAAFAHLGQGSLSIKGGETFSVGQVVDVKFFQEERHAGNYTLHFSKDGGKTNVKVNTGTYWKSPTGEGITVTYPWTVPNEPTTQGQFWVCQSGDCADPDYGLKSGNFTVQGGSAIGDVSMGAGTPSLRFDAATRSLEIAFTENPSERVLVEALDLSGRSLGVLYEGVPSSNRLSIHSNRLPAGMGTLFRVKVGARAFTHVWNGID